MRKKIYHARSTPAHTPQGPSPDVILPDGNVAELRAILLTKHLGRGADAWVWAASSVLHQLIAAGTPTVDTVAGYGKLGLGAIIDFVVSARTALSPQQFTTESVSRYIAWLKLRYPNGSSAKTYYQKSKALLIAMHEHGEISSVAFPRNPFPGANGRSKKALALSEVEEAHLAAALKRDIIAIFKGTFVGSQAEQRGLQLLVIALRTGSNATPLLELSRDAIEVNPLVPHLIAVRTVKRRASRAIANTLRGSRTLKDVEVLPTDGAAILNMVLRDTQGMVPDAPEHLKPRMWLYRSAQAQQKGQVRALTQSMLSLVLKMLVARHELTGDDGKPMVVNLSRLRTSKLNRQLGLSGGDLEAAAAVNANTPAVAGSSYVQMTPAMRETAATFVGTVLPGALSKKDDALLSITPVNRCSDPLNGARAPGNGTSHCERFTECLGCPNFVVVGSERDLFRLLSYQEFLRVDLEYVWEGSMADWRTNRQAQIETIDRLVKKLPTGVVKAARSQAAREPHPFWSAFIKQARTRAVLQHGEA